mmetsp:Transcript_167020/g.536276  ORF Transcript_167020/g.536276 Transcript_167020/m.536276 type:complete len:315 (-) Transcript_167020:396-1340(-)
MWQGMVAAGGFSKEVVEQTRAFVAVMDQTSEEFLGQCDIEDASIDGTAYGSENSSMKVLVFTPKTLAGRSRPAQLWFHGGAFVAGNVDAFRKSCAARAVHNQTVVISPEIGVAPELKAPHWFGNGIAAVKWAHAEAERLGIDVKRIAVSGESHGAYTGLGVCMKLAEKDEAQLVKLAVLDIPGFNNDFLMTAPEDEAGEMHKACSKLHMQSVSYLITDDPLTFDWAPHKSDPNIFPAQMDEKLLPKLPPIVLMTREFDHVGKRGSEQFAQRLKPHGKLVGLYIQPGTGHGLGSAETNVKLAEDEALIFKSFLHA